jgi:phosphopantothenate synthetase
MVVDLKIDDFIETIKKMPLDDIEKIKNAIIKREIYFKKFKKDKIENIISDFKNNGYNDSFLSDLENGLKKSSIYNEN